MPELHMVQLAERKARKMAWSDKARRAAALARKRKAKGRKKPIGKRASNRARRAGKEIKRRYQAGHKGPGANYRRARDRFNSKGYYTNRTGNKKSKRAGKAQRAYRKVSTVASAASSPAVAATYGASYLRHRNAMKKKAARAAAKKKKTNRRR